MADDPLTWLQSFYLSLCDDNWEHSYGCDIANIDNPGWSLKFDLSATEFENDLLDWVKDERSEHDWLHYHKEGPAFAGFCGPKNLGELISHFRRFIENASINRVPKVHYA